MYLAIVFFVFSAQRLIRRGRQSFNEDKANPLLGSEDHPNVDRNRLQINGYRVEHSKKEPQTNDDHVPELLSGSEVMLRLFGDGLNPSTVIVFTEEHNEFGGPCQLTVTEPFQVLNNSITATSALVSVSLPKSKNFFYLCAKNLEISNSSLRVRGNGIFTVYLCALLKNFAITKLAWLSPNLCINIIGLICIAEAAIGF